MYFIIIFSYLGNWRLRDVERLAQGHTARTEQSMYLPVSKKLLNSFSTWLELFL